MPKLLSQPRHTPESSTYLSAPRTHIYCFKVLVPIALHLELILLFVEPELSGRYELPVALHVLVQIHLQKAIWIIDAATRVIELSEIHLTRREDGDHCLVSYLPLACDGNGVAHAARRPYTPDVQLLHLASQRISSFFLQHRIEPLHLLIGGVLLNTKIEMRGLRPDCSSHAHLDTGF